MNKQKSIDYQKLWEQISEYAKRGGRAAARPVLTLFFVLKSPDTPLTDKMMIVAALSYLVLPIDLISAKKLPIIGWIDEIGAIWAAYEKVKKYCTPHIELQVDLQLDKWFPVTEYEILPENYSAN
jgi:uncharacterized membrane protein YkvA (DUF1232 family)